jgi:two-component system, OmpR family, copper resistance phosphate regulon response regulator CusR
MAPHHLLIIEDDPDIAALLRLDLLDAGYRVTVAHNVMRGLVAIREEQPDLILLDLGLPDGDGRQILTRVRRSSSVPILILTARESIGEKVELLNLGADDYIVKPYSEIELAARIAVQLRESFSDLVVIGELQFWASRRLLTYRDREVHLSPREFDLLAMLMRQPGKIVSRRELVDEIWGGNLPAESNVIDVHLASVRNKFRELGLYGLLRTVRGVGYAIWEADQSTAANTAALR